MNFATHIELEALVHDAKKLGSKNTMPSDKQIAEHIQFHEFFVIASSAGNTRACGVTVAEDGEFMATMIDTDKPRNPVCYCRANFNAYRDLDLSELDITIEDVRLAYFRTVDQKLAKAA